MLIIGNGRLITRDEQKPFFENGAVALEGEKIVLADDCEAVKSQYPNAAFLDAKGGVIMPAFINPHEHSYSAMARGLSIEGYHPNGFLDILEGLWWKIDRNLDQELIRLSALATFIESIQCGVTTVFDHHASFGEIRDSLFAIADVAGELGIRACLCYEVSDRDGEEKTRQSIEENVAFIRHCRLVEGGNLAGMMGLHASCTLSDQTLELCRTEKPEGAGYHVHVAEGIDDLQLCLGQHGKRVVDRLMDWDILGEKTIAAHCIFVNPNEMELLYSTNTMVVHNPESNMGNACGCPPTMQMLHKGILTGLGTDGYTHDMLESYKVANLLHKHHLGDSNAGFEEAPAMLFSSNREIAGRFFKTPLGVLKEGAAADVIVLDYVPNTPMTPENLNSHILFGMCGRQVTTTVCNGKVLMKDRQLTGLDVERAMAQVREGAARLWRSVNG